MSNIAAIVDRLLRCVERWGRDVKQQWYGEYRRLGKRRTAGGRDMSP